MDASLTMNLKQQLKITTQMLQTVEFLSLSSEEIVEKIKKESETNPALIVKERDNISYSSFASSYSSYFDKNTSYSYSEDKEENNWIEGMVSASESLQTHLMRQLGELNIDEKIKNTAEIIITSLDKNGFTGSDPSSLIPKYLENYLDSALNIIKEFEPNGVGAKDWKESLIIQLKALGCKSEELEVFEKLINNELENLKNGKFELVAKNLNTDKEDVESMFSLLKTLTPYPGLKYNTELDKYIVPEVSIKKENGSLVLKLLQDSIPIVEVDDEYISMEEKLKTSTNEKDKEASKYLKKQITEATSLINLLDQRSQTLEKTSLVLLEKQKEFFLHGPKYLVGLTLSDVANEIGVHETTISRISSSKYIETDFGIFPIKYLFTNQVKSNNGKEVSKNAVKEMIKEIIENNDTGKALSDQKISNILAEKGIEAARRTVNKYRKELDIESSFSRSK